MMNSEERKRRKKDSNIRYTLEESNKKNCETTEDISASTYLYTSCKNLPHTSSL